MSPIPNSEETIIALSKIKVLSLIVAAFGFVAMGIWMVQLDAAEIESHRKFSSPAFIYTIGVLSIVFFGFCGLWGVKKAFDKKPGLVLNSVGIFDNSSGISVGAIPWSEITGFSIFEIQNQKMLVVKVLDPDKYINNANAFKRMINKANFKMCGSSIVISSNALKVNFNELLNTCNQYYSKYGKTADAAYMAAVLKS
jgi:hypothetical protein